VYKRGDKISTFFNWGKIKGESMGNTEEKFFSLTGKKS
jgi:hypothetical protein